MEDILQDLLDPTLFQQLLTQDLSCNHDLSYNSNMVCYPFMTHTLMTGCSGIRNNYIWCIGPTGPTGPICYINSSMPDGLTGQTGPTGQTEPTGLTGASKQIIIINAPRRNRRDINEEVEPILLTGQWSTESDGPIGLTERGLTGQCLTSRGLTGRGSTGQFEPLNDICNTFLNAYSITEQTIPFGSAVLFDTHSAMEGNCFHEAKTSDIWIYQSGYYNITININTVEPAQFSLVKNALTIIPGTTMGSISGLANNNINTIIYISDNDMMEQLMYSQSGIACKLQVINNTQYSEHISLYGAASANFIIPQNTASITIMYIS